MNLLRTLMAVNTARMSVGWIVLLAVLIVVERADATRPNVVIIMCDDMGFSDIGSYGGELDTPNLNRLARDGMRFRSFYNNAKCEHTRASLLTGHWWHHVGASAKVHYSQPTFAERLNDTYHTLMSGKWHAGQTPFQRGFERAYGLTDGCCNYWNPGVQREGEPAPAKKRVRRWADNEKEYLPFTPQDKDFYTTDVFTDKAIEFLQELPQDDKPFLLYLAYTAPHYPLHASEEDVAKYRGKYSAIGWDALRDQRFKKQQELGILPPNAKLSPRDPSLPAWESIAEEDRDWWDLRMATYAAMVDRMDRNIGRVLTQLEKQKVLEDTLILFFSDNGASPDSADRSTVKGSMPWEVTSYLTQGKVWANASNTPYRQYKTTDYEGGTHTPFIAHWPKRIRAGAISDHVAHLVDIAPTLIDLAELPKVGQLPGNTLVPAFVEATQPKQTNPIYWEFGKAKAIRDGNYKAVQFAKKPWELYDLSMDPTEMEDLGKQHPAKLEKMVEQWKTWRASELASPKPTRATSER